MTADQGIGIRSHIRMQNVASAKNILSPRPTAEVAVAELPPDFVAEIRERFLRFIEVSAPLARAKGLLILCHSDADGLAAGSILARALRQAGIEKADAVPTPKGGNAWSDETLAMLASRAPGALIVTDLGVRAERAWDGASPLFIDHHRPSGSPPDACATVISGYGIEPTPTSGLLALICASARPGANVDDLDWIAALSILSDLGDKAPFSLLAAAKKRYGAGVLREATTLLNAPRRSASGDASIALELLLTASSPADIARGDSPLVQSLQRDRAEVNAALQEAKKAAPKFAGVVAAVRIHTPCQVHPLIAQIWRTRLPKFIVLSVNTGFRPEWVYFSARCQPGTNLLEFFQMHRPAGADARLYGQGHDQASGGALPIAVWNDFARSLGFGPEMLVSEPATNGVATPLATQPDLFAP